MLKKLKERRAAVAAKMKAIVDGAEAEDRGLNEDEKSEFGKFRSEADELKTRIDNAQLAEDEARNSQIVGEEEEEEARSRRNAPDPREDDPNRPLNSTERSRAMRSFLMGENGDNTEDRALQERAGLRGQSIDLRFDRGQSEYGEEFGQPRTVAEVNEQYRARQAAERETRAQGVDPDPSGGFTVPNAMMRTLEIALLMFGGMRQVAEVMTTETGAELPMPTTNDTNQEGEYLAEHAPANEQDVVFDQVSLGAHKLSSKAVRVSYELMQDSATNMASLLGRLLGERLGRRENRAFTVGNLPTEPRGILEDAVDSLVVTGSATQLNFTEILDLKYSVDPAYRMMGAGYMVHDQTLKMMKQMEDGDGRPLFLPSLFMDGPDTFNGDPIHINQSMPSGTGSKAIIYGQLSKFIIRQVRTMELMRLNELFALNHQVGFLAWSRHDSRLLDAGTNPVKFLTIA